MDHYGAQRRLLQRVQALDPENSTKIMGYFMLLDNGDQEIYRLALGSDVLLHSMVAKAKKDLGLSSSRSLPQQHVFDQLPLQLQQQLQAQLSQSQSPTQQQQQQQAQLSSMVSNSHQAAAAADQ
jgi:hypothetical protein